MFHQNSNGAVILDACSNWFDAAQKLLRPCVPKAAYSRLVELYNRSLGAQRIGMETYLRMQHLSTAAVDDMAAQPFCLPMLKHPIWLRPGTPDVHEVVHTVIRANYGRRLPREP